jgi:cold shock CspA family protein
LVDPASTAGPHLGRVASFDATRGIGTVTDDTGDAYDFHATAIAGGTRRIDVGTAVSFTIAPAHRGRYEARAVTPTAGG